MSRRESISWAAIGRRSPERLGDRAAAVYLAYDLLQLAYCFI
jgi:hypothetical protein